MAARSLVRAAVRGRAYAAPLVRSAVVARSFAGISAQLDKLAEALPYREAVAFPAKNYKWSNADVKVNQSRASHENHGPWRCVMPESFGN